jgi:acyl-CoA reductase-like NAD-dependent aldehyde dehydrogenase
VRPLLLLVDLQQDYLALPGIEPGAGALVAQAAELLRGFRARGLPVAHIYTTVSRDRDRRMRHWRDAGLWRCEAGTPGHRPPPVLDREAGEAVIHKTGFSPFGTPELDALLEGLEVDTLAIAGMHLHACVRETVLGAYERPRVASILVADDAVASDDPLHAAITRRYLEDRAARFVSVKRLLEQVDAAGAPVPRAKPAGLIADAAGRCAAAAVGWGATSALERAALLERVAQILEAQQEQLVTQLARDVGKPVRYGRVEVSRTAEALRAIAARVVAEGAAEDLGPARLHRRPHGVVALITPWNNPLYIAASKLGAALAFGNAVIWKPAPAARDTSRLLAEAFSQAGLDAGVLTNVDGGARTARQVVSEPVVGAVSLTGSTLAGFAIQEVAARRGIPLQAELGGNNAALVWSDADIEQAAAEIADGAFALAGQRCTANRRVVVERSRLEELLGALERATTAIEWGDPLVPSVRMGPLINHEQRDRIASLLARADLPAIVPQQAPTSGSQSAAWYPPTIVLCDAAEHELVQEESFGPVLVVQPADDWDQALALVNGVRQGLVAAIFARSPARIGDFLDAAQAGILKVNRSTADAEVDIPFVGWKASGIGPPEHGSFDRDFYTRPQSVYR